MMRYQRVSPDIIPLPNGSRKASSKSFKDDFAATTADHFDSKTLRARSVSASSNPSPTRDNKFSQISFPSESLTASIAITTKASQANNDDTSAAVGCAIIGVGADELFSWGNRKRSRGTRISSMSPSPQRRPGKIPRQSAIAAAEKVAAAAEKDMPPPSCSGGFYTRGSSLRSSSPAQIATRGIEDRSVGLTRSSKQSPPSPPEKAPKMLANVDFSMNIDSKQQPSDQETCGSGATATAAEKLNLDNLEWPRIYLSLSRKEKEEDFLAMKGTKLPQRPKKRAKNIDKTLQYCFPGLWLADLTRGRYEVREKKCVKKKKRGLKGMESMDSDSE